MTAVVIDLQQRAASKARRREAFEAGYRDGLARQREAYRQGLLDELDDWERLARPLPRARRSLAEFLHQAAEWVDS